MLFTYDYKINNSVKICDKQKAIMLVSKMLPEYVFDTSKLENNPLTFPEVKTLIDGITTGGHKISDVEQVLNIKNAWLSLLELIKTDSFFPSLKNFNLINDIIAKDEAIYANAFRNGATCISDTKNYIAPLYSDLENIFLNELHIILDKFTPIEQSIRLFLWGSLNQFYRVGNKRTSRIMANGILINEGIGGFNIKSSDILEFNSLMIDFYDSKNASAIFKFLAEKCINYLE